MRGLEGPPPAVAQSAEYRANFSKDMIPRSRGMNSARAFANRCPSRKQRAQGMPGARRTHCLTCTTKKTHAGQHRYAEITTALPAQWFYGCSALSPEYRA